MNSPGHKNVYTNAAAYIVIGGPLTGLIFATVGCALLGCVILLLGSGCIEVSSLLAEVDRSRAYETLKQFLFTASYYTVIFTGLPGGLIYGVKISREQLLRHKQDGRGWI